MRRSIRHTVGNHASHDSYADRPRVDDCLQVSRQPLHRRRLSSLSNCLCAQRNETVDAGAFCFGRN